MYKLCGDQQYVIVFIAARRKARRRSDKNARV
jgi:hypothetical protein